jgi:hypothetical protein
MLKPAVRHADHVVNVAERELHQLVQMDGARVREAEQPALRAKRQCAKSALKDTIKAHE